MNRLGYGPLTPDSGQVSQACEWQRHAPLNGSVEQLVGSTDCKSVPFGACRFESCHSHATTYACEAQMGERPVEARKVVGSTPTAGTTR